MNVVKKPIQDVRLFISRNGMLGYLTTQYSSATHTPRPMIPMINGARTCASVQAYWLPPQVSPITKSEIELRGGREVSVAGSRQRRVRGLTG